MHSEDFTAKKTVQETYNCVLQGLPLLHSLCVENWLSPFHCDLINNYVTVGVTRPYFLRLAVAPFNMRSCL